MKNTLREYRGKVLQRRTLFLVCGIGASTFSMYEYWRHGYNSGIGLLWLLSVFLAARFFWSREEIDLLRTAFSKKDLIIGLIILGTSLFLYTGGVYSIPVQVNTDEITIGNYFAKAISFSRPDFFSLSDYFDFPFAIFYFYWFLEKAFGGLNFFHGRVAHAFTGALIAFPLYFLFRLFWARLWAGGGYYFSDDQSRIVCHKPYDKPE